MLESVYRPTRSRVLRRILAALERAERRGAGPTNGRKGDAA
jgi:hypothetical protein